MPGSVSTAANLLASASAGVIARFPSHPLDTAKARLQVQQFSLGETPRYRGLVHTLLTTFEKEGLRGLYRGFGITVVGSAPATCLYLTSYDQAKLKLTTTSSFLQRNDFLAHFLAGMAAEAFSCVLWVPIDVTKERLQIQEKQGPGSYRGSLHAITTIFRTEGVSGIYRGYAATLASFGPFSAFYFTFYEQIKQISVGLFFGQAGDEANAIQEGTGIEKKAEQKTESDVPFLLHLVNASLASAMASFVTNPLDLVKLRLQVQRGSNVGVPAGSTAMAWGSYSGIADGLVKIVQQDGMSGLFRGVGARMAFHSTTAITIAAYETLKGTWAEVLEGSDDW